MDRGAGILSNHSKNYFPESDPHSSGSRVMPIRSRKSSPPHVSGHHGHAAHGTGSGVHHPCINSQNTIQLGAHAATSNACHTARDTRFTRRDAGCEKFLKISQIPAYARLVSCEIAPRYFFLAIRLATLMDDIEEIISKGQRGRYNG